MPDRESAAYRYFILIPIRPAIFSAKIQYALDAILFQILFQHAFIDLSGPVGFSLCYRPEIAVDQYVRKVSAGDKRYDKRQKENPSYQGFGEE
jgi:hypothetical protein